MMNQITAWGRAFLDLCFPPTCLVCDARLPDSGGPLFCTSCLADIELVQEPLCPACGRGFVKAAGTNHFCSHCLKTPFHFSAARAVFYYDDTIAGVVQGFKYHGKTVGLASFRLLKNSVAHLNCYWADIDLILPVPLHVKRLRQRGFNQALDLARALFGEHEARIDPFILERCQWTESQTGLSGKERRKNLKNAFLVKQPERVKGKRVLLVDDIFTTGTTVNECARVLRGAGADEVRVFTLARVRED